MGYTHYYRRVVEIPSDQFGSAVADCKKVCKASGVKIAFEYDTPNKAPEFSKTMIRFNGIGDDGHETFCVERVFKPESWETEKDGKYFSFCKTAYKPYDICVIACLIALKHHLGDNIVVSSDGENKDWIEARNLCQETLGYGEEFVIMADGILYDCTEEVPDSVEKS